MRHTENLGMQLKKRCEKCCNHLRSYQLEKCWCVIAVHEQKPPRKEEQTK